MSNKEVQHSSIREFLEKDSLDESLKRYKESLGLTKALSVKSNDPRRIVIKSFGVEFPKKDHEPILRILESEEDIQNLKREPICIKQGVMVRFHVIFRVNNEMVTLLKFQNSLKKGPFSHNEDFVMGSYAASDSDLVYRSDSFEAPSGIFGRGLYNCTTKFTENKNTLMELQYKLKISKDWE